jgi:hypothetical protein
MKKLLLLFLLAWIAVPLTYGQSNANGFLSVNSTDCSTAGSCVSLAVPPNNGGVAIQIGGTYSGTLQFEGTADGATWVSISGGPLAGGSAATSTTSTGVWLLSTAGLNSVRVRCSAYSSGSPRVYLQSAVAAPAGSTSVSASGNSAASATGAAVPSAASYTGGNEGGSLTGVTITDNSGKKSLDVNVTGGASGTTDTDDGTVAGAQSTGISIAEGYAWDGSNWKRKTFGTAGSSATQVWTFQGIASGTPLPVSAASGAIASGSVSDGALVTIGAKADAKSTATDTTAITLMQVSKQISASVQAPPFTAAAGASVPSVIAWPGAQNASAQMSGDIVCENQKIYDASTNGNTELVAISGSKHIYVCGYTILAGGTVNVSFVTGTGTACASAASGTPSTGTSGASAGLTPAWQLTAQSGIVSQYPTHGFLVDTGSANALCLKTSAGTAVQALVSYSQR